VYLCSYVTRNQIRQSWHIITETARKGLPNFMAKNCKGAGITHMVVSACYGTRSLIRPHLFLVLTQMNPVCTLTLLLSKPSLLISSRLRLSVSSPLFLSGFRSKILCMFVASLICAARQTNALSFYFSSWIVFCVRYLRTVRLLVMQLSLYFQWYSQGNNCCNVSGTYLTLWTKISQHFFFTVE
jgi:hypothetical protein